MELLQKRQFCPQQSQGGLGNLSGPQSTTTYKGRTRADERRRLDDATIGLMVFEEMKIARCVEEGMLEESLMVDQEASIEVPVGKIKDLPQAEISKPQYRRAFEHSHRAELKGLMEAGCFELVDLRDIPRERIEVNSKWVHTYKGDEYGNFIKAKSRLVARMLITTRQYLRFPRQPREDDCSDCELTWLGDIPLGRISGIRSGPSQGEDIHASPSGVW